MKNEPRQFLLIPFLNAGWSFLKIWLRFAYSLLALGDDSIRRMSLQTNLWKHKSFLSPLFSQHFYSMLNPRGSQIYFVTKIFYDLSKNQRTHVCIFWTSHGSISKGTIYGSNRTVQPLNCEQTNDRYWIELWVIISNIWNYLIVCKEINSGKLKILSTNNSFTNYKHL